MNNESECFTGIFKHENGEYTSASVLSIENLNQLVAADDFKGKLQSLLRMCDRYFMRSLLITSFQSHGVNENTRGCLNRSLLYCKE